ncbi:hypothetical protein A2926_03210 [Candidatus Giovannonibacteria bacterium RIFCSPLOWO2_01_FULL_44_40]|nr:MAG: hypothetical protein A2926_03210 [Candidatus Giovannonibacteria bacterium RIFCSPLOWO2_01_FULL_44_40]
MEASPRERESRGRLNHIYHDIISVKNLLAAWREFLRNKKKRKDIDEFSIHLMDNILSLNRSLAEKTYKHGPYRAFKINDPKPRDIHKASVQDRLLHHALYRILYRYFDQKFIVDSYSCRLNKGTHRAINRLREYYRKVSLNHARTAWVLKCDIKKFFANIDHQILKNILEKYIGDADVLWLLGEVIESFCTKTRSGVGLPLGNLTSQLMVNVYMNEFDQFIKRELKVKYYIRYADDFVILHDSRHYLETVLLKISEFLKTRLRLPLHPDKVFIKTVASGVDFLGWVNFPNYRILRTSTKRRMIKRLDAGLSEASKNSYLGLLKHGNTFRLKSEILKSTSH